VLERFLFVMVAGHIFVAKSRIIICHLAGSFAALGFMMALSELQMCLTTARYN
jgi:hypothetical protein